MVLKTINTISVVDGVFTKYSDNKSGVDLPEYMDCNAFWYEIIAYMRHPIKNKHKLTEIVTDSTNRVKCPRLKYPTHCPTQGPIRNKMKRNVKIHNFGIIKSQTSREINTKQNGVRKFESICNKNNKLTMVIHF